jgi:diaminopimelate decarboxylase
MLENIAELCHTHTEPFFVYDGDGLQAHAQKLVANSPVKLWYAVKANPLSSVIKILNEAGFCFDVASRGELHQVLSCGVHPSNVLFTGPAKTQSDFQLFLEEGVRTFVCESENQVRDLNQAAQLTGIKPQALLRVQLDWSEAASNVLGGCSITPFGLPPENWESFDWRACEHIEFTGLHIFQWGNILDAAKLDTIWREIIKQLSVLSKNMKLPVNVLDLGGGLGLNYQAGQSALEWNDVADALQNLPTDWAIWMELGRYVVGPFGYYVVPVVDRKTVRGKEMLVLAGGINHLLRPLIVDQNFPAQALDKAGKTTRFLLHGPLCTAVDSLGEHELPEDMAPGDVLVFSQAGAYAFTEAMPFFLCHDLPAEILVLDGKTQVIRKADSAKLWLK